MKIHSKITCVICLLLALFISSPGIASDATDRLQESYLKDGASSFSAQSGALRWKKEINGRSCTTCHSSSVKNKGQHKRTGKIILPMAPSVNSKRLTRDKNVEKWFLRNCKWTYGRTCTPQEKGDILEWLKQQ